jgi:predicted nucleic-acid-binding Zn-ribbon protein
MQHRNYECPKCHNRAYNVDQMQATGGLFTKLFNIQNKKFTSVTCTKCTYTEFYKSKTGALSNIFDFFTN